ncbi:MAG: TetR/AcrR family transcriptional regulator [Deltaproteobacteria bacterium]|nr:TetR/AcrR family transcriptional regulator [Deltaproteobacteria bacterium]
MTTSDGGSAFRGLDKSLRIQKIIDTAAEIFHKKGYRSTTLDDVARKLGITKAAIYHYVSSKEKLLSKIYIQALENIFRNTYEIAGRDLPPDKRLELIIRNHIESIIIKSISMFSVFFTEENQLPQKEFKKIQREKKKYTEIIEAIIEEGICQNLFRAVDPKLQAFAIIGMCNWVYKWYKPGPDAFTPAQIADHFVGLLQKGYLTSEMVPAIPIASTRGGDKNKPAPEKESYEKLKAQCIGLMALIDELENSG